MDLLQGTLDLLVLQTLAAGPAHGQPLRNPLNPGLKKYSRWDTAPSIRHCSGC